MWPQQLKHYFQYQWACTVMILRTPTSQLRTDESCAPIGQYFRGCWPPPIRLTPSFQRWQQLALPSPKCDLGAGGYTHRFQAPFTAVCLSSRAGTGGSLSGGAAAAASRTPGGCRTGQRSVDRGASDNTSYSPIHGPGPTPSPAPVSAGRRLERFSVDMCW